MKRHQVDDMISSSNTTTNINVKSTITEKRAVTDDSIRIYQENVNKARNSVLDAFKLKDSSIELLAVAFRDGSQFGSLDLAPIVYRLRFKFGGVVENLEFELDYEDQKKLKDFHMRDQHLLELMINKISKVMATRILGSVSLIALGFTKEYPDVQYKLKTGKIK